jgi:hypothetical protein
MNTANSTPEKSFQPADFTLWQRENLEQFAVEAYEKIQDLEQLLKSVHRAWQQEVATKATH